MVYVVCVRMTVIYRHILHRLGEAERTDHSTWRQQWRLRPRGSGVHLAHLLRRERVERDPDGPSDQSRFPVFCGHFFPVGHRIRKHFNHGSKKRLQPVRRQRGLPRTDE